MVNRCDVLSRFCGWYRSGDHPGKQKFFNKGLVAYCSFDQKVSICSILFNKNARRCDQNIKGLDTIMGMNSLPRKRAVVCILKSLYIVFL